MRAAERGVLGLFRIGQDGHLERGHGRTGLPGLQPNGIGRGRHQRPVGIQDLVGLLEFRRAADREGPILRQQPLPGLLHFLAARLVQQPPQPDQFQLGIGGWLAFFRFVGDQVVRIIIVLVTVLGAVEIVHETVVIRVRDRLVRMSMALHATERDPLHRDPGGVDPVLDRLDPELLVVGPALRIGLGQAQKRGGRDLIGGGFVHRIAGELVADERGVRQIAVERLDQPVAIRPDHAVVILFITLRVGVPRQVHPHRRPALAVARGRQQPLDHVLVGSRGFIRQERCPFLQRRRQAGQVEADPAQPLGAGRFRRGRQIVLLELIEHVGIHRSADPVRLPR